MVVGVSIYSVKMVKKEFGFSFYFAIAAAVLHTFIGVAGGIQKLKSGWMCKQVDIL